jgi:hypothetical protein
LNREGFGSEAMPKLESSLFCIPLTPHLPNLGLIDQANFFMDDTKSQYPKPDPTFPDPSLT